MKSNKNNLTKGMRDGGKFANPKQESEATPAAGGGPEGSTDYEVGDQDNAEASAGEEGAHALAVQKENGMYDAHSSYTDPMKASPTGMEK